MRVLVIEDSEKLRRAIGLVLRRSGYVVDASGDGEEGLWMAGTSDYDAVVLDLMLPRLDGLSVLKRLRAGGSQVPLLILTVRSAVEDRVAGLSAGADDYLTKPFAIEELLARVGALVRRKYGSRNPVVRVGDLEVDTAARAVKRGGVPVALTAREYRLIEFLAQRSGVVVSRSEIEAHLYGDEAEVMSNTVESTISVLRKKLDLEGSAPLIRTRRGMGYTLEAGLG